MKSSQVYAGHLADTLLYNMEVFWLGIFVDLKLCMKLYDADNFWLDISVGMKLCMKTL